MSNIEKIYEERLNKIKSQLIKSKANLLQEIEICDMTSQKFNVLAESLSEVLSVGKANKVKVFPRWQYGPMISEIMGIMYACAYSGINKPQACELTGLSPALLNKFTAYAGQLPYADELGIIHYGSRANAEMLTDILQIASMQLGWLLDDLSMYSQEYFDKLYDETLKKVEELANANANATQHIDMEALARVYDKK